MKFEALLVMLLPSLLLIGFIVSGGISYIVVKFIVPRWMGLKNINKRPSIIDEESLSENLPEGGSRSNRSKRKSRSYNSFINNAHPQQIEAQNQEGESIEQKLQQQQPGQQQQIISAPDLIKQAPLEAVKRCLTIFLLATLLIYFQLTLVVFRSWDCQTDPYNQNSYFAYAPSTLCVYESWYVALAVTNGFVLGVIGFPVLWSLLIITNRHWLNEYDPRPWLGVLYRDYRPPFGFWLSVEAAGYVLVAASTAFCSEGTGCLPFWGTIVLMFFMLLHVFCRPHKLAIVDVAWVASYCAALVLMIWARIGFYFSFATTSSKVVIITMFVFFILMLTPLYKPANVILKMLSSWMNPEKKKKYFAVKYSLDGEKEAEGLLEEPEDEF